MAQVDNFGGTSIQELGEERGEGVVFSVVLKRVRYSSQETSEGHLQWKTCRVRTLRAGTVERLVEHLAPFQDDVDVSYRTCFLCTYRTFTTTSKVLQLLTERFEAMNSIAADSSETVKAKRAVQSAILSFLWVWLESTPSDFFAPPTHADLVALEAFAGRWAGHHRELQRILGAVRQSFVHKTMSSDMDSWLGDFEGVGSYLRTTGLHPFTLFSLPVEDFASALTAEDAYVFTEVIPHQCLSYVRQPKLSHSATVRACIQHFNRVSLVVIATVLEGGASERKQVVVRWIDVAQQCRLVKNFSSLKAILSGLQSSAVFRLHRTWESVPFEKVSLFRDLSELFATDANHQISRDLLNREGTAKHPEIVSKTVKTTKNGSTQRGSVQGVVPYLGTFLTDLTMIHTAHSDTTQDGMVNFDKHRREFELLAQLTLYQKAAANYAFAHHPPLVHWLGSTHVYTEDESYHLSKEIEPEDSGATSHSPPHSSLLKRTLRQLFLSKGAAVSDSVSSGSKPLKSSLSERDITSAVDNHLKSTSTSASCLGASARRGSLSPSLSKKMQGCHIIKVAISNHNSCLYKSVLLNESDKASTVIRSAMEKHGLRGSPSHYTLVLMNEQHKRLHIPEDGNVYYSLSSTPEQTVLLLELKESIC